MPKVSINAKNKAIIMKHISINEAGVSDLTINEIVDYIKKEFDITINKSTLSTWLKLSDIKYKKVYGKKPNKQMENVIKNTKRIRMIVIIIQNLCKELGLKPPSELYRMRECLDNEVNESNEGV